MMRLKNNTKVKLIALFSAIALWMYVIAIVDPEDTKLIEDIPVTVSNLDEVDEKDLVVYPDESLLCSMNVSGKLSNVKNVDKEDIKVYGEIDNPIEGKNEVYLRANMSERVSHEFTQSTIIINLEKKISKEYKISLSINDKDKENIESVNLEDEYVNISGPRSQMSKVKKVVGKVDSIKVENNKTITKRVRLIPVDSKDKEVNGIKMNNNYVNLYIKMLASKSVPVKVAIDNEDEPLNYELSKKDVTIVGKESDIKNIKYIETEKLNVDELKDKKIVELKLTIPAGIKCDDEKIRVNIER